MIKCYTGILFVMAVLISCRVSPPDQEGSTFPGHSIWSNLLKKHVRESGLVDYQGFMKDREQLEQYLSILSNHPPDEAAWSREEQIAYWINVYNAYTIDLILDHYPVQSIKDIGASIQIPFVNTPWDIKFITIGEATLDLNNVEHGILRDKFDEPRIHFAVNCASISCPVLRREAYTGDKLDLQLDEQAKIFINDPQKNRISMQEAAISRIFSWYKGDFTNGQSLIDYLNKFSTVRIADDADIHYMEYDWGLNDI